MQTIFNERMDTKKLRQKILDLAIRGKLVPQNPNDEPASVLLERIQAEKERLIKEGKIKRGKKSDTAEIEAPFEVPESWKWMTIGDVCETCLGKMLDKQKNLGQPQLYLRNVNVRWGAFDLSDLLQMPFEDDENERYSICYNDLVVCEGGEPGRCAIWKSKKTIKFQKALHRIRCYNGVLNQYLQIILDLYSQNGTLEKYFTGSTIKHLTGDSLNSIIFPLPTFPEQQRIANEVERWFAVIDELESNEGDLLKAIDQAKSKILDLAIHGKLVPQDPNDEPAIELLKRINPKFEACEDVPYDIPESWVLCNLGVLYNIVSAKRVHKSDWKHKGIPFYRAREIVKLADEGHVDNVLFISESHYEEMKTKYGVPNPTDIMMSAVGTIGRTYEVKESDIFYYKDASVLCLQNVNSLYSPYICLLLSSQFLQDQMFAHSKGTTVDTITIEKANSYVIPLPPIAEQHRIVAKIEELFAVLDSINESLA